jgi:hypothetical protein
MVTNGCETSLTTLTDCGACGVKCQPGEKCSPTGCVAMCQPPLNPCGDACVDLATSVSNCGMCSKACPVAFDGAPLCTGGTCGLACPADKMACDDACVDLGADPNNCGQCGLRCPIAGSGPAVCSGGACQCSPGFAYCSRFSECGSPHDDSAHCGPSCQYCAEACIDGTCQNFSTANFVTGVNPGSMISDGGFLYWADPVAGTIQRIDVAGGTPEPIAKDQAKPDHLAVDEQNLYWVNLLGAAVMKVAKSGGMPEVLAPVNQPAWVAIDETFAYFTSLGDKTVMRVPKAGGMPSLVTNTDVPPHDLIVVGDSVVYQQCSPCDQPDPACSDRNTFLKVAKSGGTPSVLDPLLVSPSGCTYSLLSNGRQFVALTRQNAFEGGVYDESGQRILSLDIHPSYLDRDFVYGLTQVGQSVKRGLCLPSSNVNLSNGVSPAPFRHVTAGDDRFLYEPFGDAEPSITGIRRYPR